VRIGHGYDVHKMKYGRPCVLCGITIPYEYGPDGHSDADVPLHALMDAILGAAALGDIGHLFPDTDEEWRGADSTVLLSLVNKRITECGYCVYNCDITIIAQKPRLSSFIDPMRNRIAETLGIPVSNVNVKATTEEGLGFTGSCEGISAHAVVLLTD